MFQTTAAGASWNAGRSAGRDRDRASRYPRRARSMRRTRATGAAGARDPSSGAPGTLGVPISAESPQLEQGVFHPRANGVTWNE